MTDLDLRELLHERVADETAVDLSARAWRRGRAVRRRRGLAVVGGVVAGSLAASGVVAWVDSTPPQPVRPDPAPEPAVGVTTPADEPTAVGESPDGRLGDLPVHLGPTLAEEPLLPPMEEERPPLPPVVDATAAGRSGDVQAAVVAVTVGPPSARSVLLLGADGSSVTIATDWLEPVGDVDGNVHDPETAGMLSPGGSRLAFPQGDHVMVLTVADGSWLRLDLPAAPAPREFVRWHDERSLVAFGDGTATDVDVETGRTSRAVPYAPVARAGLGPRAEAASFPVVSRDGVVAQSWYADAPVTGAGPEAPTGPPEVLVVDNGEAVVLAVPDSVTAAAPADGPQRYKGCCPAATWVAPGVPAYLSRSGRTFLIAWHPGTSRTELVTEVVGASGAVSFADFS